MTVCALCGRRIEVVEPQGYPGILHVEGDLWAHATCYWRRARQERAP